MKTFVSTIACVILSLFFQLFLSQPLATDFDIFYRAAVALRAGTNPYHVDGFYSPIYLLIYYLPFTAFPEMLAIRLNSIVSITAMWIVFWRFSKRNLALTLIAMMSGCVGLSVVNGNNDFMPMLAGLLNPAAGVWLALTKPQMSIVLVAVFLIERPRSTFLWASLGLIAALYGVSLGLGMSFQSAIGNGWNLSVFPLLLPLGVIAARSALRLKDRSLGLAASPLFAPYVGSQSWLVVFPWLMQYPIACLVAFVVSWRIIF